MSTAPQNWRDLAALLDPVGRCSDPLAEGRLLDWYAIYALAAEHLIAPTLYAELVRTDRLRLAPADVQDALAELHRLNDARNNRQRAILRDTVRVLNAQGIEPLLLKGGITLLDAPPQATTRMMSDLDIALHNAPPERGEDALLAAGYWHAPEQGPLIFQDCHHVAPLFHPSGEGYVEIHRSVLSSKVPVGAISLPEVCAAAEPFSWDGLRLWIPSVEHRLIHNVLHHQIQDAVVCSDRCALRQLMEFALLRAAPAAAEIDWNDLLRRLDYFKIGDPVRVYLLLAEHLFGQPLPANVAVSRANRDTERRVWFWIGHQRMFRCYAFAHRLKRLPARLLTPSWYPAKLKQLRRDWAGMSLRH